MFRFFRNSQHLMVISYHIILATYFFASAYPIVHANQNPTVPQLGMWTGSWDAPHDVSTAGSAGTHCTAVGKTLLAMKCRCHQHIAYSVLHEMHKATTTENKKENKGYSENHYTHIYIYIYTCVYIYIYINL